MTDAEELVMEFGGAVYGSGYREEDEDDDEEDEECTVDNRYNCNSNRISIPRFVTNKTRTWNGSRVFHCMLQFFKAR